MIKIFKKIRKKLLADNQFNKYLGYAFGEILLVVIGILVALQVNTWNQNRQLKKLEKKILLEIHQNLESDVIELEDDLEGYKIVIESASILIHHFKSKSPFNDSIGAFIHIAQLSPHIVPLTSGYKLLESKGIEVVSNDSLRTNVDYNNIDPNANKVDFNFIEIANKREVRNTLQKSFGYRNEYLGIMEEKIKEAEHLIAMIDNNLK
jgi:hypothetical protein